LKKSTILSKRIIRSLENYKDDPGSHFNLAKLLENKCLYYEMEDHGYHINRAASGMLRQKIISTLLDIYEDWQEKLREGNFNYYLAIWLYIPRISHSQVVCAIEDKIGYYDNEAFLPGDANKKFESLNFGKFSDPLRQLSWELKIDLDQVYDWEVKFPKQNYECSREYRSAQRIYRKNIKNAVRKIENANGNLYLFPVGDVWVGKPAITD
jgi:hypothetical protein